MKVAAVIFSTLALYLAVAIGARVGTAESAPPKATVPTLAVTHAKTEAAKWKRRARRYKRQAGSLGAEVRRLRAMLRRERTKNVALHRKRDRVVLAARRYLGTPYVFGGASAHGIDCSGLSLAAYRSVGVSLPHLAASQEHVGRRVYGKLRPGDLVFFNYGGHVGVYVGHGDMIAASSARGRVVVQDLATYPLHFDGARRIL